MRQSYKNEIILSQAELDAAMARGRKMRAAAFAYYMGALGRSIAGLFRRPVETPRAEVGAGRASAAH